MAFVSDVIVPPGMVMAAITTHWDTDCCLLSLCQGLCIVLCLSCGTEKPLTSKALSQRKSWPRASDDMYSTVGYNKQASQCCVCSAVQMEAERRGSDWVTLTCSPTAVKSQCAPVVVEHLYCAIHLHPHIDITNAGHLWHIHQLSCLPTTLSNHF